jgi:hypothetical protein
VKKITSIAITIASFVVFTATFLALAENKNGNSLFLDSDQDGLTDQEERMIGTDPNNPDTDGDGYSDGKEVESGYSPLKPAPGDRIVPAAPSSAPAESDSTAPAAENDLLGTDALYDLSSDPENPNLTNEMIGQLMQLTEEKGDSSDSFLNNPSYSSEDLEQVAQKALQTVDITKDLPEIKDSELNILPPVDNKKLDEEEIKEKQKEEIEKYLSQSAFIFAANAPFPVENPADLQNQVSAESDNLIAAVYSGDKTKVDEYAQKAQAGIDQMKKVAVPHILKDIHKSMLQLAIYTLNLKDDISLNTQDPIKSLAAASSLQVVAQGAMKLQSEFSAILTEYDIESINFP